MLVAASVEAQRPAEPVAIVGAIIVDPRSAFTSAAAMLPQTVLIANGIIQDIGPVASIVVPKGSRRINADGKFIIPGLWDSHVRFTNMDVSALPLNLALGITSVRELGGSIDSTRAWQKRMRAGALVGPRILTSGPVLESPASLHGVARDRDWLRVGNAADAKTAIDSLVKLHVDFVAVGSTESADAYFAILREAHHARLKVAGRQPSVASLLTAVDSGQNDIEHAFTPPLSRGTSSDARDTVYLELARAGTWYSPTLVVSRVAMLARDSLSKSVLATDVVRRDERRPYAAPALLDWWRSEIEHRVPDATAADSYRSSLADVRRMRELGVLMLAGSDAGSVLAYPGFALHEELALLVEDAGLTPSQALWSATVGPAMFAGLDKELGTVTKGKIADLVVLDANPVENIRNTRRIAGVVQAGRYRSRVELDAMLAKIRGAVSR